MGFFINKNMSMQKKILIQNKSASIDDYVRLQ